MKASKFNIFYDSEEKDKLIAYNSRTNALALMSKGDYEKFENMIDENVFDKELKLTNDLLQGGFLIEDNINELEILKYLQLKKRFSTKDLGLTIAPTLGCNFACVYCYQKDHSNFTKMSKEVQDKLIEFIRSEADTISILDISWYGGEPLLAMDVIEELSYKIIEICKEKNISYSATIVTNGYLLNKDIVKKFKELKIQSMQVTLDGCEKSHDSKRFLSGGQPTFKKIIENIADIIDDFSSVAIRINTDKNNKDEIFYIFDVLSKYGLKDKVIPYLGYIEPINGNYEEENCLTVEEFSKLELDFTDFLSKSNDKLSVFDKYPRSKYNYCCADSLNAYVIDPEGKMYKCWSDIGREEYCLGTIKDGIKNPKYILEYSLYDTINDSECKDCKVLPICMGGCPRTRVDKNIDRCAGIKYTLEDYLRKLVSIKDKSIDNTIQSIKCC
ncbi:radical SAM/SPASM domain-containing protein [Clostridium hydrogeniformans]|uniref:radical SAM/SPASM domain-containing protein n=1 Tax=Clostridium hydrogeniformans TaxID=349933 RepID=UPI00048992AD|nr:radical SAM protein [Clostridium hydrogeniformans]